MIYLIRFWWIPYHVFRKIFEHKICRSPITKVYSSFMSRILTYLSRTSLMQAEMGILDSFWWNRFAWYPSLCYFCTFHPFLSPWCYVIITFGFVSECWNGGLLSSSEFSCVRMGDSCPIIPLIVITLFSFLTLCLIN